MKNRRPPIQPMRLLHDLILVQPDTEADKTYGDSDLVVPDRYVSIVANDERTYVKNSDQFARATILQTGPGKQRQTDDDPPQMLAGRVPLDVEAGDVILYRRADGSQLPDGRVMIRPASIVGTLVLEPEDESS